ncbi:MAG: response regulator [Spirochaetales bacterium]|nr:response regulator [Spirochaetales bacterium]
MKQDVNKTIIIMAEDDEDDRIMMQDACLEAGISIPIHCVANGEELMDLLQHNKLKNLENLPLQTAFILLDLNMPKLDGRKTLELIKKDENLKKIPIIIFTTSDSEEDISWAYTCGASSFITKPSSFESMVNIMKTVKKYWIEIVTLPQ